jgi:hypothetical protein
MNATLATHELEGAARRASAELALATAQAERALYILRTIRQMCATHEQIPGSPYSDLISRIDTAAAAATGPL